MYGFLAEPFQEKRRRTLDDIIEKEEYRRPCIVRGKEDARARE